MFEDCLVESKSAPVSATKRWTTVGSITIQTAVATLIAILPLLHPERLSSRIEPPRLLAPVPPRLVIYVHPAAAILCAVVDGPSWRPAYHLTYRAPARERSRPGGRPAA